MFKKLINWPSDKSPWSLIIAILFIFTAWNGRNEGHNFWLWDLPLLLSAGWRLDRYFSKNNNDNGTQIRNSHIYKEVRMPLPGKKFTQEELDARKKFAEEAISYGAIQRHSMSEHPNAKFEIVSYFGSGSVFGSVVWPVLSRVLTPKEWVEEVLKSGKIPVVQSL